MMNNKRKYFLTASIILLIGITLFITGGAMCNFDITALSSETPAEASHTVTDTFDSINISSSIAEVTVLPSTDGVCRVECKETKRIFHEISVTNGTLKITIRDTRAWYHKLGWFFIKMKVTVYLPEENYNQLTVKTNTGDIKINSGLTFENVYLKCSTGNIRLESDVNGNANIKLSTGKIGVYGCTISGEANMESSTGNITFKDSTAKILKIEADTGDIKITDSDAEKAYIETDTGDVKGHFLTDMIFYAHSDTGKVRVPKSTVGGICEIESDTGDIIFE